MKKGMTRLIAWALVLMLALSAGALAAETPSNSYRVPDAQERPEAEPEDAGAEVAPEAGGAEQEPQAPAEPEEPDRVIGKKQVALNDPNDSVKIFAEASKDSAVIGNAFHGDVVEVLRVSGGWTKIRLGGTVGYIASAHLAEVGAAVQPAEPEVPAEPETPTEPEAPAEPTEPEAPAEPEATEEPVAPDVPLEPAEGEEQPEEPVAPDVPVEPAEGEEQPEEPEAAEKPEAPAEPEPEPEAEPEPEPQPEAVPTYNYERDADGNLVLDANGNPVPVLPEGAEIKPVAFQRDADGNLVLDENGNPIPSQFVPVGAQKIDTIQDALDPSRSIDVYADWGGDELMEGDEASLYAVLRGYDRVVYTLQWQYSVDGATWQNIEGETEHVFTTVVNRDNYLYYWRVEVTITDVVGDEA